jgi:hypothetical protein
MGLLLFLLSPIIWTAEGREEGVYLRFGKGLVAAFVPKSTREHIAPFFLLYPDGQLATAYEQAIDWPRKYIRDGNNKIVPLQDMVLVGYADGKPKQFDVRLTCEANTSWFAVARALYRIRDHSESPAVSLPVNAVFYFRLDDALFRPIPALVPLPPVPRLR